MHFCSLHFVLCSLNFVLCTSLFVLCTSFFALCSLHFVHWTLFFVHWTLFFVLCFLFFALCTLFFALCSLFIELCSFYSFLPLKLRVPWMNYVKGGCVHKSQSQNSLTQQALELWHLHSTEKRGSEGAVHTSVIPNWWKELISYPCFLVVAPTSNIHKLIIYTQCPYLSPMDKVKSKPFCEFWCFLCSTQLLRNEFTWNKT